MKTKKATIRAMKRPAKLSTKPIPVRDPGFTGYRKGGAVKGKAR